MSIATRFWMIILQTKFDDREKLCDRIGCKGKVDMTQATIRGTTLNSDHFNVCRSILLRVRSLFIGSEGTFPMESNFCANPSSRASAAKISSKTINTPATLVVFRMLERNFSCFLRRL
jgi:hypothetical protein